MAAEHDHDDDFDPDEDGLEDEDDFNCHLMPDGQCMLAGTEECDWVCPFRDSEHFAGSPAHGRIADKRQGNLFDH